MIRAGRSHGVEDHGNNTLSVLFKVKLEQMSCVSVGQKQCVSVAARRPFRKSQIHQNFVQAWSWALSKKKNTLRGLCPRGLRGCDSFCPRRELSIWYRWFSLCKKTPHTHTLHTIHTHTHSTVKESCLAWFVVADHEEGEAEVKKVESVLLCLGKRAVLELQSVHDQLLWLFDNVRKLLKQELHKSALEHSWSECSSSTSRLIWSPKRHFVAIDLPVAEKTPECMCYPILGQRKLKANNVDRQLASTKAQRSSCFDLDSDHGDPVTVLVPRQTEVSISVWGKPSVLGNSLLSTNQRPFIYTGPQALSWRPSTIRSQVGPGSRLGGHPFALVSMVTTLWENNSPVDFSTVKTSPLGFSCFWVRWNISLRFYRLLTLTSQFC